MPRTAASRPEVVLLGALAEEELGAVAAGEFERLGELHARRDAALAALPAELSDSEQLELRRALGIQRQVERLLEGARDRVASRLARLDRGRHAARAYGSTAGRPASLKPR